MAVTSCVLVYMWSVYADMDFSVCMLAGGVGTDPQPKRAVAGQQLPTVYTRGENNSALMAGKKTALVTSHFFLIFLLNCCFLLSPCSLQSLGKLRQLRYLDLAKNRIETLDTDISGCEALEDLLLSSNMLQHLPDTIGIHTN